MHQREDRADLMRLRVSKSCRELEGKIKRRKRLCRYSLDDECGFLCLSSACSTSSVRCGNLRHRRCERCSASEDTGSGTERSGLSWGPRGCEAVCKASVLHRE
eukprot:502651-Rhodomonas_salina.2